MKAFNFSKLLFIAITTIITTGIISAIAEEVTLTTYYPAPTGNYNDLEAGVLTLTPGAGPPIGAGLELEGMFYYDDGTGANPKGLYYCEENAGGWVPLSGAWITAASGTGIYYDAGNVGIGMSDSTNHKLDVSGNINTNSSYKIGGFTVLQTPGTGNTLVGQYTGSSVTTGAINTMVGYYAGHSTTTGQANTFIGGSSGYSNTTGISNTFIGQNAGQYNTEGVGNTYIGREAGRSNVDGDNNTFVGRFTGHDNTAGSGNVFIGNEAGRNETGSDKLYIANSPTNTLIYGDFSTGNVGIGETDPQAKLHIGGTGGTDGIMFPDGTTQTTSAEAKTVIPATPCILDRLYWRFTSTTGQKNPKLDTETTGSVPGAIGYSIAEIQTALGETRDIKTLFLAFGEIRYQTGYTSPTGYYEWDFVPKTGTNVVTSTIVGQRHSCTQNLDSRSLLYHSPSFVVYLGDYDDNTESFVFSGDMSTQENHTLNTYYYSDLYITAYSVE